MSRLVLINGVPGTGKSTLANLYVERHPLSLALDLDVLRSMLGGWLDQPTQAGLITRAMAIEAARVQLNAGRDVVVPQYLGRLDFVRELEQLSRETGAELIEIVLLGDPDELAARFYRRCANPGASAHVDAARLLERSGGAAGLREMHDRLSEVVSRRPASITVESVDGEIEDTYAAVLSAMDTRPAPAAPARSPAMARRWALGFVRGRRGCG